MRRPLLIALWLAMTACNVPTKLVSKDSPEAPRDLKLVCVDQFIVCQGEQRTCVTSTCRRDCFAEYETCLDDPDIE
ncbi:MAG: hypothetical protein IT384_23465 [Deltaproteobacteria bacterium]|nr:hypothetical protein [Deltaproteobacteria bacterium]